MDIEKQLNKFRLKINCPEGDKGQIIEKDQEGLGGSKRYYRFPELYEQMWKFKNGELIGEDEIVYGSWGGSIEETTLREFFRTGAADRVAFKTYEEASDFMKQRDLLQCNIFSQKEIEYKKEAYSFFIKDYERILNKIVEANQEITTVAGVIFKTFSRSTPKEDKARIEILEEIVTFLKVQKESQKLDCGEE